MVNSMKCEVCKKESEKNFGNEAVSLCEKCYLTNDGAMLLEGSLPDPDTDTVDDDGIPQTREAFKKQKRELYWIVAFQFFGAGILIIVGFFLMDAIKGLGQGLIVLGAMLGFLAISLIKLKKWAWIASIVLYTISSIGNIIYIFDGGKLKVTLIIPIIFLFNLYKQRHLFKKEVKKCFK
jgi:hypothetical protein